MLTDFTRSNVAEQTLDVSSPRRSSFDLYHRKDMTLPIGRYIPANVECLMPSSVLAGDLAPEFALETLAVPNIGPLRLDTHTVAVSARRINQDWRKLIEGKSNVIPSFVPANVFTFMLETLCPFDQVFSNGRFNGSLFLTKVRDWYKTYSTASDDEGYLRDFFVSEYSRLRSYESEEDIDVEFMSILVHAVMEPYFGEGSIMDNLGYPIFGYYSSNRVCASELNEDVLIADGWNNWGFFFKCSSSILSGGLHAQYEYGLSPVNEMLLRASYAAWYDALRNWHVEERSHLLDPDNWGYQPVIVGVGDIPAFYHNCELLVSRYRTFGNDAFTTVQTDDVYRHVFNPIFTVESPDSRVVQSSSNDSDDLISNTVHHLFVNGVSSVFPQGLFRRNNADTYGTQEFYSDLVTMRRSGMLERYLARDYFYPDTYEGQIRARWGISPADLLGCTSKYISGSESFISGDQQISATGTDGINGTPAGTRTFTGGASGHEKITFSSDGDFIYLVTFVSLQPVPTYDAQDMHLVEVTRADLPFPEFADDTRVQITASNMIRGSVDKNDLLGFVPRYYQYRTAMDSVHGRYLRDYRSYVWLRDWYAQRVPSLFNGAPGGTAGSPFSITAYGLHVHVPLDAFLGDLGEWSHVAYGCIKFNFAVDAPLPAAVEHI